MNNSELCPCLGYALIKLVDKYESGLSTPKEKYEQYNRGLLCKINMNGACYADLTANVGCMVYFKDYESTEPIDYDNDEYVFVPVGKIMGYKIDGGNDAKA